MVKKLKKDLEENINNDKLNNDIKSFDIKVFDSNKLDTIINTDIDINANVNSDINDINNNDNNDFNLPIDENLTSRFIKKTDDNSNKFIWEINKKWWSRLFEYQWCKNLMQDNKDSVVLDAGCGLVHPFRFILAQYYNNVYACDINSNIDNLMGTADRIKEEHGLQAYIDFIKHQNLFKKINHSICSITKTNYQDKFFNNIFCISTLEHLNEYDVNESLKEFNRILKDNGRLIITLDIPNKLDDLGLFKFNNLDILLEIINKNNFKPISNIDLTKDNDILECNHNDNPYNVDINVFRLVLVKNI